MVMASCRGSLRPSLHVSHPAVVRVSAVCSEIEEEMEFQEFKRSYLKGMADEEYEDGNVSAGDDMAPKEK